MSFWCYLGGVSHHFQQYLNYIVAVSFIGGGNHRTVTSHWQTLSQCCIEYTSPWMGFKLTMLVVIGIDCIGSYTSKFHTIMTTMAPRTEEDRIYNIYLYTVIHMFCKHRNSYLGFVEDLSVPASKHAYSICPVKYKYQLITCFVEIILLVQASRLSYIFFFLVDWLVFYTNFSSTWCKTPINQSKKW